jgi:hypothetical protein
VLSWIRVVLKRECMGEVDLLYFSKWFAIEILDYSLSLTSAMQFMGSGREQNTALWVDFKHYLYL